MFDGLDAISWIDLTDAYGSAEKVPMQLLLLLCSDANTRETAMNHLYGRICHQGWISPATAYAVPYFLEMLQDPGVQVKGDILKLLKYIARSDPELEAKVWRENKNVPTWNVPVSIPFKNARLEVQKGLPIYLTFLEATTDSNERMQAIDLLKELAMLTPDVQMGLDMEEQ